MERKKNKTTLFFFTAEYPFAVGETFIENEIGYLSAAFDEVLVLPYSKTGTPRELPSNIRIAELAAAEKITANDFFLILKILLYEFTKVKHKLFFLKKLRTWYAILKRSVLLAKRLKPLIEQESKSSNPVFYSYWMNEWALALAILKHKKEIPAFVFRCGGYDIWDERYEGNYLPFRFYVYKQTAGIFPNSKMGETYLKKYAHYADKIKCLYWGTADKGVNPFDADAIPCIVSCSSLIPLKRVGKIAETLKHMEMPVKWVHFGDGPLMEELQEQVKHLPAHIHVELKGNVRNSLVMECYTKNTVTCFINASSTESLPVSIQEAISFGIPAIGTRVGGVPEIVNAHTGLLLDVDFDEKEAAVQISKLLNTTFCEPGYRASIRNFWKENFSAEKNYTEFVTLLKSNRGEAKR